MGCSTLRSGGLNPGWAGTVLTCAALGSRNNPEDLSLLDSLLLFIGGQVRSNFLETFITCLLTRIASLYSQTWSKR